MGKLFGTDGIRGVVGQTLTAELAFHVGQSVAAVLAAEEGHAPHITIGKDTRISSDMLEAALTAGICSVGGHVIPLGTMPTPAVAFLTVQEKADAGIVISASHNPYEYNGIKVFNAQGYKLSDAMEQQVEDLILTKATMDVKTGSSLGRLARWCSTHKDHYLQHLLSTVDADFSGLRVLVDCANGAASATAPDLFAQLPLTADFIHREPDGININNGCGSTHLEDLAEGVIKGKYDLGIAYDGDADRCLLVDETGETIDGDKVLAVCADMLRREGRLSGNSIVGTVMSNLGLREYCRNKKMTFVSTPVGDRHVLEKMLECDYAIGGEQSGHTIFRAYATTGDGELTSLQFLQALVQSGEKASVLAGCCPQYPQELINVEISHAHGAKEAIMSDEKLWRISRELEATLHGEGRILIRPSGTEALIRVMVEAKTDESARFVAKTLADYINKVSKKLQF